MPQTLTGHRAFGQLSTVFGQLCSYYGQNTLRFCPFVYILMSIEVHIWMVKMTVTGYENDVDLGKIDIRNLPYSPTINPLMELQQLRTRRRLVQSGRGEQLVSSVTGEVIGVSAIRTIEERDDAEFVKVFASGVAASYDLTKTAQRVFTVVLDQYQRTPMSGGYADSVKLFWFGDGLDGRSVDLSERTFRRGLKELLSKRFLYPKTGEEFWVNPGLFFKGDRVMFIREYVRKKSNTDQAEREALEARGQQRLTG